MAQNDASGAAAGADQRLRMYLGLFMGLMIVVIVTLTAYNFWQRRLQTIEDANSRAHNLAHVLAEHLTRAYGSVDTTLANLVLQGQRIGGAVASPADWEIILDTARAISGTTGSISVVDAEGIIRASTLLQLVGQSRVQQPLFRTLKDNPADTTRADTPIFGQATPGLVLIPLGRRLTQPDGSFAGMVVTTFIPERLRDFYKSVNVGTGGHIRIVHSAGIMVLREPPAPNPARGDDAVLQRIGSGSTGGTMRVEEDGHTLLTAYERTGAAGLTVAVALSEDEMLADWRRDASIGLAATSVLVLALLAAMYVLRRELIARRLAESRLVRAQKMEAIGQLTGGIAHDFNNLLTVIVGCADDLADSLPKTAPEHRVVQMIAAAGDKAASLTSQLLAFSRRQVLQPVSVDVNQLVNSLADLLRRTLGEEVEIEFVLHRAVSSVTVDPAQLESALLNLAINARDAMRGGGKLTIETAQVTLDAEYARRESDVRPGEYVMLAVSDTGTGMTPEVLERAFEPFFTTKPTGRGTGLGLSMVFGFVKQSDGHIKIYSEFGHGTTIKLYLPCRAQGDAAGARAKRDDAARRGHEIILAVEDDPLVRDLVIRQLSGLGYTVIAVNDGPAAIAEIAKTQHIDLLFTDVVLPAGMSGRDLATRALALRPGLRVLYTSGYTPDAIVHHGRLDPDVRLLQKPYTRPDLAKAVRAALDENL